MYTQIYAIGRKMNAIYKHFLQKYFQYADNNII